MEKVTTVFDYLKWRGELSFKKVPFNNIDNLILSRFCNIPFDNLHTNRVRLKDLEKEYFQSENQHHSFCDDNALFKELAKSKRYQNLKIVDYINTIDYEKEVQFSVTTLLLDDNTYFIGYRGTDDTLVGWKEDLNMAFLPTVPAQDLALQYLNDFGSRTLRKLRIGGHSKGGNLAVFASVFTSSKIQKKILAIYNNDGPGFSKNVMESEQYKAIKEKLYTFVPQTSFIGMLLEHEEDYKVVHSVQVGVMQHDVYSWEVMGNDFVYLDETTEISKILDHSVKQWVSRMTQEERIVFVDTIYQLFMSSNIKTFTEFASHWLKNSGIILKKLKRLDGDSKKMVYDTIIQLLLEIKKTMSLNKKTKKLERAS